jgi:hypothetical protein
LHLNFANKWGNNWDYIKSGTDNLSAKFNPKYQKLNKKLQSLSTNQVPKPHKQYMFYPRVVNNTNTTFSNQELTLPSKDLKYNLHTEPKKVSKPSYKNGNDHQSHACKRTRVYEMLDSQKHLTSLLACQKIK